MKRRLPATFLLVPVCFSLSLACAQPAASGDAGTTPTASSLLDDGGTKLAAGDFTEAIRILREARQAETAGAKPAQLLAIAYLRSGQYTQAISAAEGMIDQPAVTQEDRAVAALLLGEASYHLLTQQVSRTNKEISLHNSMQLLLEQMAPHPRVLPTGNVVIDPGDEGLQNEHAAISTSLSAESDGLRRTLAKSEAAYRLALGTDPKIPGGHDGLGRLLAASGYPDEARQEFLTELKLNGPSGAAYLHLGEIDLLQHEEENAVKNLRLSAALSPQSAVPYQDLAQLYAKRSDKERVQWAKGMAALRRGDLGAAGAALSQAGATDSDVLVAQAELALARKNDKDASALLNRARTLAPKNTEVVSTLGDVEEARGRHEQAISLYQQALEIDVNCGAAWYGTGLAYDAQKNPESALADYRQALEINPNDSQARLDLAADEADLGQKSAAVADLQEYLRRFPIADNIYEIEKSAAALQNR